MWNRKAALLAVLAVFVPTPQVWADELTPAKKADARAFVDLTGAKTIPGSIAVGQTQNMAQAIRRADAKFPDRGFEIIRDSIGSVLSENAGKPDGLYDQMAAVYATNFTHDEIKELIRFYSSAIGKKLNDTQSKLGRENMQVAGKWASQFAPEIDKRMQAGLAKENIKLPQPPSAQQAPAPAKAQPAKPAPAPAKPAAPAAAPAAPK
jgi:uncharacterized protein